MVNNVLIGLNTSLFRKINICANIRKIIVKKANIKDIIIYCNNLIRFYGLK